MISSLRDSISVSTSKYSSFKTILRYRCLSWYDEWMSLSMLFAFLGPKESCDKGWHEGREGDGVDRCTGRNVQGPSETKGWSPGNVYEREPDPTRRAPVQREGVKWVWSEGSGRRVFGRGVVTDVGVDRTKRYGVKSAVSNTHDRHKE